MTGNDEFDRQRAAAYAWRWLDPTRAPLLDPGLAALTVDPPAPSVESDDITVDSGERSADEDNAVTDSGEDLADATSEDPTSATGEDASDASGEEADEEVDEVADEEVDEVADEDITREPDDGPPPSLEALRESAHAESRRLAAGVDRLWGEPDEVLRADLEELLEQAAGMGMSLMAMQSYPRQSVRLARLALRVWPELSQEACFDLQQAALWLDYSHAELVELLVEVGERDELGLATTLMLSVPAERWRSLGRTPGAVARLARVVDEAADDAARAMAVRWLSRTGGQQAVPALRRALRRPHYVLRYLALAVLDQHAPGAIEVSDTLFLLGELIEYPPPPLRTDAQRSAALDLPRLIERSLERQRPREAIELLTRVAQGHFKDALVRPDLGEWWGWGLLARVFPDAAVPLIDQALGDVHWDRRLRATEAAGLLPDALAWPRLLTAGADGVPEIIEAAASAWRKRRARPIPLEATAGLRLDGLDAPPSDRLLGRLELLRRGSVEARSAMVEVLLGEAPDREALALLLFASADNHLWWRRLRPGLPDSLLAFARRLLGGFGPAAAEGLVERARLHPHGRGGWLSVLAELAGQHELPDSILPAVQALAVEQVRLSPTRPPYDALSLVASLGAPASLFEPLWALARDQAIPSYLQQTAARALTRCAPGDPRRDARIEAEMAAALEPTASPGDLEPTASPGDLEPTASPGDLPRFARVAVVGVARRQPAAVALVERVLAERASRRPARAEDTMALGRCVQALADLDLLPADWCLVALAQPGTHAFAIATRRVRRTLPDGAVPLLRVGLSGDEPIGAALAAETLLFHQELLSSDERLPALAARAPVHIRTRLLSSLLYLKAPLEPLLPLLDPLLTSPDPAVTGELSTSLYLLQHAGHTPWLLALRPRLQVPEMLERLDELLPPASHWQDLDEDDEGDLADLGDDDEDDADTQETSEG